ncbi:MAG TPA: enoyl-CoA hydratase-related protein [Acidimicrobiales bacterium]|nr:enoyl-CoA hydratase-related protein [Acidimicrobiales bacterium]
MSEAIDTGTEDLLAEVDEGVAVITLNRPDRRNAFSATMLRALGQVLARAETDSAVGALLLTGAGGAFSAGGDVKGFAARAGGGEGGAPADAPGAGGLLAGYDQAVHAQRLDQRRTSAKLYEMPKPTLAALPGPAAGAGLALALACDLRMAASTAFLTTAFANVGFSGDYGGTWFMRRLVGEAKTKEMYFLSERVGADEAARLGLVNWVVAPDELETRSRELARRLAAGPTVAYRYMKENINRAALWELGDCMDLEVTHHIRCSFTEDHREASRAFVEKRPPVFHGR